MGESNAGVAVSVLSEHDLQEIALVRQYGAPDVYINAEEAGWHPWVNGLMIKPYRYETKSGSFVFILWAPKAAVLGKHRHRGVVTAVTMQVNGDTSSTTGTPAKATMLSKTQVRYIR